MQVVTRSTVHLDATDVYNIVLGHLYRQKVVPENLDVDMVIELPEEYGGVSRIEMDRDSGVRFRLEWEAEPCESQSI